MSERRGRKGKNRKGHGGQPFEDLDQVADEHKGDVKSKREREDREKERDYSLTCSLRDGALEGVEA